MDTPTGEGDGSRHDAPGNLTPRREVQLLQRAVAAGWPISEADRARTVEVCLKDVRGRSPWLRLLAARTLVRLDGLNVKRQRNAVDACLGADQAHAAVTAAYRDALASPAARAASQQLGEALADAVQDDRDGAGAPLPPRAGSLPTPGPEEATAPVQEAPTELEDLPEPPGPVPVASWAVRRGGRRGARAFRRGPASSPGGTRQAPPGLVGEGREWMAGRLRP